MVRCIELSKKRSYINAYRNRKENNIRIDVGNFQDIEQNLTEKYDYITLIGVFEYSEGYIGGKDPYVNMLKKISTHLKPGGRHRHCHREPAGAEILGRLPGGSRGRVF